jgi:hypothetical protein
MFSAQGEFKFNTLLLPQGNYQRPLGGVLISMAWTNSCQGKVGIAQNAHQTGGLQVWCLANRVLLVRGCRE